MDGFFGFMSMIVVIGAAAFLLGRQYQRTGRLVPDEMNPFLETNRPAAFPLRGMGLLWVASFALVMTFAFSTASEDSRDPFPAMLAMVSLSTYWLLIPIWVYRDAKARGERAWAWGLMTLITNLLGLFSYLITRPEHPRACPRCGYKLRSEFLICPYCGPQAGRTCGGCQSVVEADWAFCPYCREALPANGSTKEPSPAAPPPSVDPNLAAA